MLQCIALMAFNERNYSISKFSKNYNIPYKLSSVIFNSLAESNLIVQKNDKFKSNYYFDGQEDLDIRQKFLEYV
jgi:predicted transcriptional regulator